MDDALSKAEHKLHTNAAYREIEQLKRKIEQLEAELAALKTAFGETFQRRSSGDRWALDTSA